MPAVPSVLASSLCSAVGLAMLAPREAELRRGSSGRCISTPPSLSSSFVLRLSPPRPPLPRAGDRASAALGRDPTCLGAPSRPVHSREYLVTPSGRSSAEWVSEWAGVGGIEATSSCSIEISIFILLFTAKRSARLLGSTYSSSSGPEALDPPASHGDDGVGASVEDSSSSKCPSVTRFSSVFCSRRHTRRNRSRMATERAVRRGAVRCFVSFAVHAQ
jgi:hypothetical protein